MGGENCCIVGCTASRARNRGLSFFHLPNAKKHPEWRSRIIQIVKSISIRADPLNLQRITICSLHFTPECIIQSPGIRKKYTLKAGSLPTLKLAVKSVISKKSVPRKSAVKRTLPLPITTNLSEKLSFNDISKNVKVPSGWIFERNENNLTFYKFHAGRSLKIIIDSTLECRQFYNDYLIPCCVKIQRDLYSFLVNFENSNFCLGILDKNLHSYSNIDPTENKKHLLHVNLKMNNPHEIQYQSTVRSTQCQGFSNMSVNPICKNCYSVKVNLRRKFKPDTSTTQTKSISSKTALQRVSKGVLTKALKESRKKIKLLKKQVEQIQTHIKKDSVLVKNSNLHDSLMQVTEKEELSDPLIKLFWEQQKLAFSKASKGHRWHPMLIRLAI